MSTPRKRLKTASQGAEDLSNDPDQDITGDKQRIAHISCNRCRRVKIRCSRGKPCTNCSKIGHECSYVAQRSKPGMKAGAIETIYRRLDAIESVLFEKPNLDNVLKDRRERTEQTPSGQGLLKNAARSTRPPHQLDPESQNSLTGHNQFDGQNDISQIVAQGSPRADARRHRVDDDDEEQSPPLPPLECIEKLFAMYMSRVHPWIPMINQDRFREKLKDPEECTKLSIVIHAMWVVAGKFLSAPDRDLTALHLRWTVNSVRRWVVATAIENLSLEGIQALIMVAFNDIGSGNGSKAWPIVASLSRTVEYYQLTRDADNGTCRSICRPYNYLEPAQDWADEEERRRIFWNVFLLDRFCSISMGWSISLTSTDVCQRLPSDGHLWRKGISVLTPYMGVWDKSTGSTGAALSPRPLSEGNGHDLIGDKTQSHADDIDWDMSRVGQFAYCLEATESMSRVTSCFLQQSVDFSNMKEVNWWLGRFKELDLRLAHWKLLLPHVSKPANPAQNTKMDPNLTLAHITHNASTILLHQPIAYPPPSWQFRARLPSSWSASTCCHAGNEICTITQRFLRNYEASFPISSQIAFCAYIAGRMMLVDWRYYGKTKLSDDFWLLVESLNEIGRRWAGGGDIGETQGTQGIALRYAAALRSLRDHCLQDELFLPDFNGYTQELEYQGYVGNSTQPSSGKTPTALSSMEQDQRHSRVTADWPRPNHSNLESRLSYAGTQSVEARRFGTPALMMNSGPVYFGHENSSTSQGQQGMANLESEMTGDVGEFLMHLDRVIAYDDGSLFTTNLEQPGW